MNTHWTWIAALWTSVAIGCNAETHGARSVSNDPTTLGSPGESTPTVDAAVACPAGGQPAPQPQDAAATDEGLCNGGKLVRSNIGYTCDCAGTERGGPFCDGADEDAGTTAAGGHTLSFSSPYYSSCAVMQDHTVRCWGHNEFGELGDGTRTDRNVPTKVMNLDQVEQVDIGLNTTCAVRQDASLRCWGYNGTGLVHDDSNNDRTTPTEPKGITNVVQVSLGDSQACVRHSDDTLECWTGVDHDGLVAAANGTHDVVDVEASFFTTTAWLRDGSIRHWGSQTLPTVPAQARIKRIVSGYYHACVLTDDGRVYCLGNGAGDGQSGQPEGDDRHVQGISDAIDIAAGFEHTCALLRDHSVRCWGQNERGQLGDGTNDDSALPVKVVGAEHVTNVQCGRDHSCARFEDGSISCWGSNQYGQLGDGSGNDSNTPVRVQGL